MLIPVGGDDKAGTPPEWALIELQGRIEYADEVSLVGQIKEIGMLQIMDPNADKLQLTIGYHQLEGKRVPLKKPMAVLEKVVVHNMSRTAGHDVGLDSDQDSKRPEAGSDNGNCTKYSVRGVIRSKYLFNVRPMALISKPYRATGQLM